MNYFRIHFLRNKRTHIKYALATLGTKIFSRLKIFGNTKQESTTGKNLLNFKISSAENTKNNLTYKVYKTQVKLFGKPSANTDIYMKGYWGNTSEPITLKSGTYTLSIRKQDGTLFKGNDISINMYYGTNSIMRYDRTATSGYVTKTFNEDTQFSVLYLSIIQNGTSVTFDDTFYIQLEQNSNPTPYEPYTGNMPSPSPDYPQEIESVGDKTKNLFDKNNIIDNEAYRGEVGTTITLSPNYNCFRLPIFDNKFDNITISSDKTTGVKFRCICLDSNSNILTTVGFQSLPQTINTSNCKKIAIFFDKTTISLNDNIMIQEGTTATPYEPYGKYKIPVNVRSENIFNTTEFLKEWAYYYYATKINENSFRQNSSNTQPWDNMPLIFKNQIKKGKEYYLSFKSDVKITIQVSSSASITKLDDNIYKIIPNQDGIKIKFLSNEYPAIIKDIQITEGTNPKPYQPYFNNTYPVYLDQPLRKIDDYADYIDWKEQKVVRNIGEVILNGSEGFGISGNGNYFYYNNNIFPISSSGWAVTPSFSNYFTPSNFNSLFDGSVDYGFGFSYTLRRIAIRHKGFNNYTDFKTWLSNHNTTVDYILETPTEETIDLPEILKVKGTNIIEVLTKVKPSKIEY